MKNIYITDLDHTFLRSDRTISKFSHRIWKSMSAQSPLSIATARSFYSTTQLLKDFDINIPMILLDGALIVSPEQKIIHSQFLDQEIANSLIKEGQKFNGLTPFVIGLKEGLDESLDFPLHPTKTQAQLLHNFHNDPRLCRQQEIYASKRCFKLVYMGTEEEIFPLNEHLQRLYGDSFGFKLAPENYTQGYFLTILSPDVDKSKGLSFISEYLDRDLEDFTVFGDSINDIEMFKAAGTSVAVSNALEQIKQVADIILDRSNDDDAVAHYLQEYL